MLQTLWTSSGWEFPPRMTRFRTMSGISVFADCGGGGRRAVMVRSQGESSTGEERKAGWLWKCSQAGWMCRRRQEKSRGYATRGAVQVRQ